MPWKYNPFTGKLDKVVEIDETISHASLSDMPDIGGTNSDHDTRYLKLDGSNANSNIDIGAYDLTTGNLIAGSDNTYDIGAMPTSRWKDAYFAGQINAGTLVFATSITGANQTLDGNGWTSAGGTSNVTNNLSVTGDIAATGRVKDDEALMLSLLGV